MGGGGIVGGRVEVINGKGCSRRFLEFSSSFRGIPSFLAEPVSPVSPASAISESQVKTEKSNGPFSGLVICVTGLSKETRKQVKEATEGMGGQYSPHLHPQCTHMVIQSLHGPKYQHALKHGPKKGLLLVTIGWFVDSVKRNVRLNESLYAVNNIEDIGASTYALKRLDQRTGAEISCDPVATTKHSKQSDTTDAPRSQFPEREGKRRTFSSSLSGQSFYVDPDVPSELRVKVAETLYAEGATLLDQWFVGCNANHVVCEGPSVRKYLGHSSNLVTPLWVLKSAKEKCLQRLVGLSADLARHTRAMLDTPQNGVSKEEVSGVIRSGHMSTSAADATHEERKMRINLAKDGVRKRRNRQMQTCQTPIRPINPSSLLNCICWSISEPASIASIYTESSIFENANGGRTSMFFDATADGKDCEASFVNLTRPLAESEKSETIFKSHFLTVLFPVDLFSEMGPSSRTFFSNNGFTCLQVLDHIYAFYQENMSVEEIEIAIHTDSRHADRLRSAYASKERAERGFIDFKRIAFLGSRKSFEMLKRVSGDNNSNVYELLLRA